MFTIGWDLILFTTSTTKNEKKTFLSIDIRPVIRLIRACFLLNFFHIFTLENLYRSGNPAVLAPGDESKYIRIAEKTSLYIRKTNNFNSKNKEPLELLEKIGSRYEKFLKEFLADRPNLTKSVTKQISSLWERMGGMYTKLNPKCKFYEISDANDTNER